MQIFENQLINYPKPYITDIEIAVLLTGKSDHSRYSKVKRMIAQKKLIHIRRGLYLISTLLRNKLFHSFELAAHIYTPSYISLESALSYHQLIPEAVHTVTSVTINRNREFNTPLGIFSYNKLPIKKFFMHTKLIKEEQHSFIIATPWKAIFDYVYCYKPNWQSLEPLFVSMRIDIAELPEPNAIAFAELIEYYGNNHLTKFIQLAQESYYEY